MLDQDRVAFLQARQPTGHRLVPAWPRKQRELPEKEVEVTWVRFSTLNHRTRAEQLRVIQSSGRPDLFSADPLGQDAQYAQYSILTSQEGFVQIKDDLRERGQQEPAIVTAEGVLINGNRRAAALRSLFEDDDWLDARYIQCLVLPQDATAEELVDLEAELQVARDFKQAYSWINEAMLIEELYDREGKDFARVAKRMHRPVADVRTLHEKLQQVHQIVALSQGARLHVDFTGNESAFDELSKHIRNKSAAEADSVRSAYLLGTLSNVEYRRLRAFRRPDAAELVLREIERDPALKPVLDTARSAAPKAGDGDLLDDLLGEPAPAQPLNDLLGIVASSGLDDCVTVGDTEVPTRQVLASLRSAITVAAEEAEEAEREQSTAKKPVAHLDRAVQELDKAIKLLPRARTSTDWNEAAFTDRVTELTRLLGAIADEQA